MNYILDYHPDDHSLAWGGRCLDEQHIYLYGSEDNDFRNKDVKTFFEDEIKCWSFIIEHEHIHACLHRFGIPLEWKDEKGRSAWVQDRLIYRALKDKFPFSRYWHNVYELGLFGEKSQFC